MLNYLGVISMFYFLNQRLVLEKLHNKQKYRLLYRVDIKMNLSVFYHLSEHFTV
jgi:hypothetical protein